MLKETQVSEFQPQVGGVGLKLKCRMMLLYYSFDGRSVLEGPGGEAVGGGRWVNQVQHSRAINGGGDECNRAGTVQGQRQDDGICLTGAGCCVYYL